MKNHQKIFKASLLVAFSGILYGFLGYFGTMVMQENMSISTMLLWRFFIAGIWILFFNSKKFFNKKIWRMDRGSLIYLFILAAIGYAGSSVFYFISSQYTGTGLAMTIFFSYPIIIAIFSWFSYRRNFNLLTAFALAAMFIGLLLLENSANQIFDWIGIVFGILAAVCYAFYIIGSKRTAINSLDSNIITTLVCFICSLTFFIISLSTHTLLFPQSFKNWLNILILGVFATALPIQLMLEGLKYISSMRASMISVLEPLITIFIGVLFLNESFSLLQTLGAIIILGSAILVQFERGL